MPCICPRLLTLPTDHGSVCRARRRTVFDPKLSSGIDPQVVVAHDGMTAVPGPAKIEVLRQVEGPVAKRNGRTSRTLIDVQMSLEERFQPAVAVSGHVGKAIDQATYIAHVRTHPPQGFTEAIVVAHQRRTIPDRLVMKNAVTEQAKFVVALVNHWPLPVILRDIGKRDLEEMRLLRPPEPRVVGCGEKCNPEAKVQLGYNSVGRRCFSLTNDASTHVGDVLRLIPPKHSRQAVPRR